MKKITTVIYLIIFLSLYGCSTTNKPAQIDTTSLFPPKIKKLLEQMTLEEKVAELTQDAPANTRLGIPEMLFGECLHGLKENGATSFPQAVALGSTWDPDLLERVASSVAYEARRAGITHCYTPVLDVTRDPRYGRFEESYAEDPLLTTRLGVAYIKGLQGTGKERFNDNHIMATAKHFAGYSEPHRGINGAYVDVSKRTMYEIFFPPFEAAVKEAKVGSIMPAHQDLNGMPAHMSQWLLRDVLREEWGFKGVIVSDNNDIQRLYTMHKIASSKTEAAKFGLKAGVDIDLVLGKHAQFYSYNLEQIKQAIEEDPEVENYVNESVARILQAKFDLGLFERPTKKQPVKSLKKHQVLALEAARSSLVLLKNDKNVLPLDAGKLKSIAVIGPNAHDDTAKEQLELLGGYSRQPPYFVSIYSGLKNHLPEDVTVRYSEGVAIDSYSEDKFEEAITAARQSDVVILAMGGSLKTAGEGSDRDSIDLPGAQLKLMQKIHALGKPTVLVLINGRPLDIRWASDNIPAIFETWYTGMEGGNAIAETLLGKYNPGGKLSVSLPRHIGHIPVSYLEKPDFIGAGKGQYINGVDKSALYAFGYGQSYTTFSYSNLRLEQTSIKASGKTRISVDVTNTGELSGDEVVQFYVKDDFASVGRYNKLLRNFKRISLKKGETQTVSFDIGFDELALYDIDLNKVVEPGAFTLYVGSSSRDQDLKTLSLNVTE